jgi:hypothetical protein
MPIFIASVPLALPMFVCADIKSCIIPGLIYRKIRILEGGQ